jgi:hypothetical protein
MFQWMLRAAMVALLGGMFGCGSVEGQENAFKKNVDAMEALATKQPMRKADIIKKLADFKAEKEKIMAGSGDKKTELARLNGRLKDYMTKLDPSLAAKKAATGAKAKLGTKAKLGAPGSQAKPKAAPGSQVKPMGAPPAVKPMGAPPAVKPMGAPPAGKLGGTAPAGRLGGTAPAKLGGTAPAKLGGTAPAKLGGTAPAPTGKLGK